jgi:hypothetical protein
MAAAMQVTPDAADIAACILLQRHFRGNRCRGKVTRSELGVRSLRTNAGEAGGHGLRLVQLLQLRRVASASPSTRSDQDIDVVGRVFGDLESAACNPQLEQPFFASMDEGQRRELHRHLQLAPLRQTEYLFHQGDLSNDTFYYVVSGTVGVALVEDEASGRHTIVKRLGAGATFGENALATDVPAALRTSTIVGVEDCMLGTITRSAYLPTYSLPTAVYLSLLRARATTRPRRYWVVACALMLPRALGWPSNRRGWGWGRAGRVIMMIPPMWRAWEQVPAHDRGAGALRGECAQDAPG